MFVVCDVELRVRREDEQSIAIKLPVTDTVKLAKQKIQVDNTMSCVTTS